MDVLIKKPPHHSRMWMGPEIGWGKLSPVVSQVALTIHQSIASHEVYLSSLDKTITEEQLRNDLSRFSLTDQLKTMPMP